MISDTSDDWDLVIVGAGPAGSAAALSALRARQDARVLLLDRARFPRDKSCGDGIAPHALDELARMGAADVLADRTPIRTLRLRSPAGRLAVSAAARPNYVVPRTLFDARLVEAAVARGAVLRQQRVRTVQAGPGGVLVDGSTRAAVVVGADGANGVVRRQVGIARQPAESTAVAVRGYAAAPAGEPEQVILMAEQDWPAYAWSFAAGDGTANVGFGMLLPSLRNSAGGGRAELHGRLAQMLPGTHAERLVSHHLPLSTWRPRQPDGRVLLAGDAAALINPLTGEGIFYALLSGRLAGATAVGGSASTAEGGSASTAEGGSASTAVGGAAGAGSRYRAALEAELGRHLRHTTWLARLSRRPGIIDAGVAASDRSTGAFDALVELGLGRGLVTAPLVAGLARALLRPA